MNKTKESEEVTDAEVDTQIKDILRQKLAYERLQGKAQKQTHTHEDGTVHEGPSHDHADDEHIHDNSTGTGEIEGAEQRAAIAQDVAEFFLNESIKAVHAILLFVPLNRSTQTV